MKSDEFVYLLTDMTDLYKDLRKLN